MKGGVRYPFYVSSALLKGRKSEAGSISRVRATEIEATVLNALRQKFAESVETIVDITADLIEQNVARIVLRAKHVVIALKSSAENGSEPIEVPWWPRQTRELAQIDEVGASSGHRPPNPRLVQAVVRAHAWLKLYPKGTYGSIDSLARAVDLHPKHVRNAVRLAFLSPAIIKSIIYGDQRTNLTLGDLAKAVGLSWKCSNNSWELSENDGPRSVAPLQSIPAPL